MSKLAIVAKNLPGQYVWSLMLSWSNCWPTSWRYGGHEHRCRLFCTSSALDRDALDKLTKDQIRCRYSDAEWHYFECGRLSAILKSVFHKLSALLISAGFNNLCMSTVVWLHVPLSFEFIVKAFAVVNHVVLAMYNSIRYHPLDSTCTDEEISRLLLGHVKRVAKQSNSVRALLQSMV